MPVVWVKALTFVVPFYSLEPESNIYLLCREALHSKNKCAACRMLVTLLQTNNEVREIIDKVVPVLDNLTTTFPLYNN